MSQKKDNTLYPKKILSLDWGLKKTGVAVGENGFPAQTLSPIESTTRQKLLNEVDKLAKEYKVKTILIGLPSHPQNSLKVKKIKNLLKEKKYQVVLWEETLTSKQAEKQLKQSGHSRKSTAKKSHSTAAAIMLEEYLC